MSIARRELHAWSCPGRRDIRAICGNTLIKCAGERSGGGADIRPETARPQWSLEGLRACLPIWCRTDQEQFNSSNVLKINESLALFDPWPHARNVAFIPLEAKLTEAEAAAHNIPAARL